MPPQVRRLQRQGYPCRILVVVVGLRTGCRDDEPVTSSSDCLSGFRVVARGLGIWTLGSAGFCRRTGRKDRHLSIDSTLTRCYIPPSPRHRQERLVATPMVVPRLNHVGAGSGPVPVLRTLSSHGTGGQLQP